MKRVLVILIISTIGIGWLGADGRIIGGELIPRKGPMTELFELIRDNIEFRRHGWTGGLHYRIEESGLPVVFLHYVGEPTEWDEIPDNNHPWIGIQDTHTQNYFGMDVAEIDALTLDQPDRTATIRGSYNGLGAMMLSVSSWDLFNELTLEDDEVIAVLSFIEENAWRNAPEQDLVHMHDQYSGYVERFAAKITWADMIWNRLVPIPGMLLDSVNNMHEEFENQTIVRLMSRASYYGDLDNRRKSVTSKAEGDDFLNSIYEETLILKGYVEALINILSDPEIELNHIYDNDYLMNTALVVIGYSSLKGFITDWSIDTGNEEEFERMFEEHILVLSVLEKSFEELDRFINLFPTIVEQFNTQYSNDSVIALGVINEHDMDYQELNYIKTDLEMIESEISRRGISF